MREEPVSYTHLDVYKRQQVVLELSGQKAEDVAAGIDGDGVLVIGADTVVSSEGRILGKPASEEEAEEMIRSLAGKSHQVYTGVTLIWKEPSGETKRSSLSLIHIWCPRQAATEL